MRKNKKWIITSIIIVVLLIITVFAYYQFFHDPNRLSIKERQWLESNKANVTTIDVPNDLNVFGLNGQGIFYTFLDGIEKNNKLAFNRNATTIDTAKTDLGFLISSEVNSADLLIYQDHYVLVSKTADVITDYADVAGSKIGIITNALARISGNYAEPMSYNSYANRNALLEAFKDGKDKYILVPKMEYLDSILNEDYKIVYHFSDLTINYYLHLGENKALNTILTKLYNKWLASEFDSLYYQTLYDFYVERLGLTQAETDTLTNKTYQYGFTQNAPYHALTSSKYGGIAISYLEDFSRFSKVEFTYNKYNTNGLLIKNFNNQKVDLIFDNTNYESEFHKISTTLNNQYYIIGPLEKKISLKNIKELMNEEVCVLANSLVHQMLRSVPEIKLKVVASEKDLFKAARSKYIIGIDARTYDYYVNKQFEGYRIRYSGYTEDNFNFKYIKNDDAFYKLFSAYINSLDPNEMIDQGLISYAGADQSGNFIAKVAGYTLVLATGGAIAIIYLYFRKNRIVLDTKIRKDDKLKFVDMLTSLKNRNYLSEKKDSWNQNTIYPQAIIVIDLNNIKYLNDTFGHGEGDKQIKQAANALIKTQLDNTEIMRTDGNEFTIYLVGYSEKQVLNYIKKLLKEFKDLPYEYGSAFGFSMIVDDLKLIDDAINEASMKMRENKEKLEAQDESKSYGA